MTWTYRDKATGEAYIPDGSMDHPMLGPSKERFEAIEVPAAQPTQPTATRPVSDGHSRIHPETDREREGARS